jgi:hypothetical protein
MENKKQSTIKPTSQREAGMMCCTGIQGVGKTYQNMHVIASYVKDKLPNKVKGAKCLIIDTNGEYTKEQFERNNIPNFSPKMIALRDVPAWSLSPLVECRRIDAKSASIKEKKAIIEYVIKNFKNGMLVLEDINTYILSVTFMEEIVGGLVNLRHRAVDVLISYQSLRPVEPRIWQNSRWVRMHYQADNVSDIKGKVSNPALFKIAQLVVNNKYNGGDKRFFVYIHNFNNKIEGPFTREDFKLACEQYLMSNKKYLKEYKEINDCTMEEALHEMKEQYIEQYYGNSK